MTYQNMTNKLYVAFSDRQFVRQGIHRVGWKGLNPVHRQTRHFFRAGYSKGSFGCWHLRRMRVVSRDGFHQLRSAPRYRAATRLDINGLLDFAFTTCVSRCCAGRSTGECMSRGGSQCDRGEDSGAEPRWSFSTLRQPVSQVGSAAGPRNGLAILSLLIVNGQKTAFVRVHVPVACRLLCSRPKLSSDPDVEVFVRLPRDD